MRTNLKSMITAAVMAAGLLISGSAAAAETTIRMLLPPTIGMLPFYVAKEKGYFQKHDLRIEDKFMFNLSTMVPAVVSGQADIVQTDSFYLLSAAEAGLDIVLVGSNGVTGPNTSLNTIVVLKESPIRTAADLVGKRVAVSGVNTHFHIIAAHWLKQNGVDPARVTFVELPFNQVADALKSGRIDAGTAAPPFSYRIATSIGRTLYNFDEMLPPGSLTGTLVATRAWANGNKDAINKYREAIEEGMAFIAKNDAESREILARYTNVAPEVYANVPFPVFAVRVVPKQLDAYVDMALEQKLIKTKIDPAKLVFP